MTEQRNRSEHFEEMELQFIELPKFLKTKYDKKRKIDQWLLFLDYSRKEMLKEIMEENENLKEAEETLEEIKQDKHLQYLAWLREKQIIDSNSMRSEGIKVGIEQEKKRLVKKMLEEDVEIDIIVKISGMTVEEVEKIRAELKNEK